MVEPLGVAENVSVSFWIGEPMEAKLIALVAWEFGRGDKVLKIERTQHTNEIRRAEGLSSPGLDNDHGAACLRRPSPNLPYFFPVEQLRRIRIAHKKPSQTEFRGIVGLARRRKRPCRFVAPVE